MLNYFKISLLLAVFVIFSLNTALAETNAGPKIVFEQKNYDLGNIREGENIKHTFRVFNRGDKLLEIKRVSPD